MRQKRGLSAIVATLIIILLTLVAVGIIWVVIRNVLQGGAEDLDINSKCIAIDLTTPAAVCDNSTTWKCNVTYHRNAGGEDIDGLRIVLGNGANSSSTDLPGNVAVLATMTEDGAGVGIDTGFPETGPQPDRVQVAAYFNDASGNARLCTPSNEFNF